MYSNAAGFGLVIYLVAILLLAAILWAVIYTAVRRALRDHQAWLDRRGPTAPRTPPA